MESDIELGRGIANEKLTESKFHVWKENNQLNFNISKDRLRFIKRIFDSGSTESEKLSQMLKEKFELKKTK